MLRANVEITSLDFYSVYNTYNAQAGPLTNKASKREKYFSGVTYFSKGGGGMICYGNNNFHSENFLWAKNFFFKNFFKVVLCTPPPPTWLQDCLHVSPTWQLTQNMTSCEIGLYFTIYIEESQILPHIFNLKWHSIQNFRP